MNRGTTGFPNKNSESSVACSKKRQRRELNILNIFSTIQTHYLSQQYSEDQLAHVC